MSKIRHIGWVIALGLSTPTLWAKPPVGVINPESDVSRRDVVAVSGGPRNGVFVADAEGLIAFHSADEVPNTPVRVSAEGERVPHLAPRGMTYQRPYLYLYDAASRRVVRHEREKGVSTEALQGELSNPTHLGASPHGLVAVLDQGKLVVLQVGFPPTPYDKREFRDASGLAFATWNTLNVLVGEEIVTIELTRLVDGTIRFLAERPERARPPEGMEWEAMDVREGILYLATKRQIYARVDEALIPILSQRTAFDDLDDFAIVRDGAYVLDDDDLYLVARALPVDVMLDGSPMQAQAALLDVYRYLDEHELLPTREVRANDRYRQVQRLWFEEDALVAPEAPAPDAAARNRGRKPGRDKTPASDFCSGFTSSRFQTVSAGLCEGRRVAGAEPGQIVSIPDVRIKRTLSRQKVALSAPLSAYLQANIPSAPLREFADADYLKKLNPSFAALTHEQVLALDSGEVMAPLERWSVTIGVPAAQYYDGNSKLWELTAKHPVMAIVSRAGFVEQSARSFSPQDDTPLSGGSSGDACARLRAERDKWWTHIKYPSVRTAAGLQPLTEIGSTQVRVGLLEYGNTVLKGHYVFSLNASNPVWYAFAPGGLEPQAAPQTFDSPSQLTVDATRFSPEAHHGTHVAGLVAGQAGPCWSGLLPNAHLVLIDLIDRAQVYRAVSDAVVDNVQVFNVSQTFRGGQNDLHRTIQDEPRALWVVAAGNDGDDLNAMDVGTVPALARWAERGNVVSVTASDWNGNVIEQLAAPDGTVPGANRGKRYVDLIAPGADLYSATEQQSFARASGTSQAAPQVASAAALLVDALGGKYTPGDAKARLLATAQWSPAYKDKVWGGRLDFGAAVQHLDQNILRTVTDASLGRTHAVRFGNDPKIRITNAARYYERDRASGALAPKSIAFSQILSIRRLESGLHRVVLKDPGDGSLKIVLDAELADADPLFADVERLRCQKYERFNEASGDFEPETTGCEQGISVTTIDTYIQRGQYGINWGDEP